MLTSRAFQRHRALPHPVWMNAAGSMLDLQERFTGTTIAVEGLERLPRDPVLITTNASHKYDFLPLRCFLRRIGVPTVSVAKGKYFQQRTMAWALGQVGVVPIISRGYVIAADFVAVHGRRPDEREYRVMREHLDVGAPLPAWPVFDVLRGRPRSIIGFAFSPDVESWRTAVLRTYERCMMETIRLSKLAVAHGYHVHLYPEGTVSSRLGTGRRGAIQLARALGLAVLPVGISGCREVFRGPTSARYRGGRIVIRFGEPWAHADAALPSSYRPFDPGHERDCAPLLDEATTGLMQRIDALLEPAYRQSPSHVHDGTTGVGRFL